MKEYWKNLLLHDAEQIDSFTRISWNFWNFEWKFERLCFPPAIVNADRAEQFLIIKSVFSLANRWANWHCIARNWIAYLIRSKLRLYLVFIDKIASILTIFIWMEFIGLLISIKCWITIEFHLMQPFAIHIFKVITFCRHVLWPNCAQIVKKRYYSLCVCVFVS